MIKLDYPEKEKDLIKNMTIEDMTLPCGITKTPPYKSLLIKWGIYRRHNLKYDFHGFITLLRNNSFKDFGTNFQRILSTDFSEYKEGDIWLNLNVVRDNKEAVLCGKFIALAEKKLKGTWNIEDTIEYERLKKLEEEGKYE